MILFMKPATPAPFFPPLKGQGARFPRRAPALRHPCFQLLQAHLISRRLALL